MLLLDRTPMAHSTWLPPAHWPQTRTRVSLPRAIPHALLRIYKIISHRLPHGRRPVLRTTSHRALFQDRNGSTRRIRRT